MQENEGRERIEFVINGLTKSGATLYINIPAKIRGLLERNGLYKVTVEKIGKLEGNNE